MSGGSVRVGSGSPLAGVLRLVAGDGVARALNLVTLLVLARVLGTGAYGVLEIGITASMYLLWVADFGVELWATRAVARGMSARAAAACVYRLRVPWCVAVNAAFLVGVMLLAEGRAQGVLVLASGAVLVQSLQLRWLLLGEGRFAASSLASVLGALCFGVGCGLFVRDEGDLVAAAAARSAGELVALVVQAVLARGSIAVDGLVDGAGGVGGVRVGERPGLGEVLRDSVPLGLASGLALMSYNLDTLLLAWMRGEEEVGLYAAAYKPVSVVLLGTSTFFVGFFPAMSRVLAEAPGRAGGILADAMRLVTTVALPAAGLGAWFAPLVMGIVYGSAYDAGIESMRLLSITVAVVGVRSVFRHLTTSAGMFRTDLVCAAVSVGVNVACNLALIPRLGGAGAAISTIVSEAVWMLMAGRVVSRRIAPVGRALGAAAAPMAATVASLGAAWGAMALGLNVWWQLAASVAVLGAVMMGLGHGQRVWASLRQG